MISHSYKSIIQFDFITDEDGGDVDTVKGVSETQTFKNQKYVEKYSKRGNFDTAHCHNKPAYRNITAEKGKQYNETGIPMKERDIDGESD